MKEFLEYEDYSILSGDKFLMFKFMIACFLLLRGILDLKKDNIIWGLTFIIGAFFLGEGDYFTASFAPPCLNIFP